MLTDSPTAVDEKTLIHRLKLEAELRAIQAQSHESRKADLDDLERELTELRKQIAELSRDRDQLAAAIDGKRIIEEEEYARLRASEYHLSRLLNRVDRGPFGPIARRRPGFKAMIEQWPEPQA